MVNAGPISPEFSRIVLAEAVGADGMALELEATGGECAALALRFGLEALSRLRGRAGLRRVGKPRVHLDVTFGADVLQLCVITLEPVAAHVSGRFGVVFVPPGEDGEQPEVFVDVEAEDPPEPLNDGQIDIGEMIAQHLSLQIDPYPRAADAQGGPWQAGAEESGDVSAQPFRRLRNLKSGA